MKQCPLTVTSSVGQKVVHAVNNVFAVHTPSVNYHYQCDQNLPSAGQISEGIYLIKLDPGCTLSTEIWYVKGLIFGIKVCPLNNGDPLQLQWSLPLK